jgi:hypothetical protein
VKPEDVPQKYRRLYERAMSGRSRRAAIRVNCLWCVGWSEHEVEQCTSPGCPLFGFRLGQKADAEGLDPRKNGGLNERHGPGRDDTPSESGLDDSDAQEALSGTS